MKIKVNSTPNTTEGCLSQAKVQTKFNIFDSRGRGRGGWVTQNLKILTLMHRQYG